MSHPRAVHTRAAFRQGYMNRQSQDTTAIMNRARHHRLHRRPSPRRSLGTTGTSFIAGPVPDLGTVATDRVFCFFSTWRCWPPGRPYGLSPVSCSRLVPGIVALPPSTSRRNPEILRRALTLPRPRWKHRHTRRQWQKSKNPTMLLSRLRVPTQLVSTTSCQLSRQGPKNIKGNTIHQNTGHNNDNNYSPEVMG